MHNRNTNEMLRIPEITTEELQTAISNKIRAEDIKACDDETRENGETNLQRNRKAERVYTRGMEESENKSDTKKGDVEDVGNDRPICSLSALHKLFTIKLYSRLFPKPDQIHAEDRGIQKLIPNNR